MGAEGPGRQPDVDEEFARIVAGWSAVAPTSGSSVLPPSVPSAAATPAGPPAEPSEATHEQHPPQPQAPGTDARPADESAGDAPAAPAPPSPPWRGYLPEEPDEHFRPPEPQLPPAHDATYWLAVIGLVGGPLLVLWAIVFSRNADPGWSVVGGILLTVAGFGLLVLRGSGKRGPDDDGSRV